MQISPSAALFQALSSLNQPQGAQAAGANASPFSKASKQAAQAETPQAEPAPGETPERGSLLDLSA